MSPKAFTRVGPDTSWPITGYLSDFILDIAVEKKCCHKIFNYNTIRVGPYDCMSVHMYYVCPSISPSICNMYGFLQI